MNARRAWLIATLLMPCALSLPSYALDDVTSVHLRPPRFEEFDKEGKSVAQVHLVAGQRQPQFDRRDGWNGLHQSPVAAKHPAFASTPLFK